MPELPSDKIVSPGRTITEADVVAFAALTWDHHPHHVDAKWAAGSRYQQRVAHGMLILAYAVGLLPIQGDIIALRRIKSFVFKRPVFLGETIHAEGEVVDEAPFGNDIRIVTMKLQVLSEERLCAAGNLDLLMTQ